MNVAVFGASGRSGQAFIAKATDAGLLLRLHYRSKPSDQAPVSATIVVGSLNDPTAVREVLRGADACVVLFGHHPDARVPFCADATKKIVASMKTQGQGRLLVLTGAMIGDSASNVGLGMRLMRMFAQRSAHDGMLQDRAEQERLVRNSGLDQWLLVKPPRLTDGPAGGAVSMGPNVSIGMMSQISRASLATALVDELVTPRFSAQTVYVAQ